MTSNAAYTPGRLKMSFAASATANGSVAVYLVDENGRKVGTVWGRESERALTADRIVCAWNAAHDAGLSTEVLEAGVVERMIEALRDLVPAVAEHIDTHDGAGGYLLARMSDAQDVLKEIAFAKQSQEERE